MKKRIMTVSLSLLGASALTVCASKMHPQIQVLDADEKPVLESGAPISTLKTCGACHDTEFIAEHNYHAQQGINEKVLPGETASGRTWDWSPGRFGRWNPITYRYLTPMGDTRLDMGLAEWIQKEGWRHSGGGPAIQGQAGNLEGEPSDPMDPDHHILDPATGEVKAWDWTESGKVEPNCFLCHLPNPDNDARIQALAQGAFAWAATVTLDDTGLLAAPEEGASSRQYNPQGFDENSFAKEEMLQIIEPKSVNCGQCHGLVHIEHSPVELDYSKENWSTLTKGQVFSAEPISESAVNVENRDQKRRPWDIHAARLMECSSCHYSQNNPIHFFGDPELMPEHLVYDVKKLTIGEYLERPNHDFVKGYSAQGTVARALGGTMRDCADCHDYTANHEWLPYRDVHMGRLSCESCHIPEMAAPALQTLDWTILTAKGEPVAKFRGIEGSPENPAALVTGYRPMMQVRRTPDGAEKLYPYNLLSSWYWIETTLTGAERPVRLIDLKAAFLDGDSYHADIVGALDVDLDGAISDGELRLDTEEKVAAVRARLEAVGVNNPRIAAEIQPYGLHHGVVNRKWAIRECESCHSEDSMLSRPMELADYIPGGVLPAPLTDNYLDWEGRLDRSPEGALVYAPDLRSAGLYILGHSRWEWVDYMGLILILLALAGISVHGGMRWKAARKRGDLNEQSGGANQ